MFQILRNGLFIEIEHLANQGEVGSHLPWQNAPIHGAFTVHEAINTAVQPGLVPCPCGPRHRHLVSEAPCLGRTLCTMGPWTVFLLVAVPPRCPHCHLQLGEAILNSSCMVVGVWLMFLKGRLVCLLCAF